MSERWASVIINNYNYGRFLGEAIESALGQTYPRTEVIVVDDGSTDRSREVIAEYAGRVTAVLKDNGGQASTCNAGFAVSRGDVVIFLDADDFLLPTAVETALLLFDDPGVAQVHWRMLLVDEHGRRTGKVKPAGPLAEGDLRERLIREGPFWYAGTFDSAWTRRFLERVLPIQEWGLRHDVDHFFVTLAPLYGLVRCVGEPQSCYRRHSENFTNMSVENTIRYRLWTHQKRCALLRSHLSRMGVDANPDGWRRTRTYLEGLLALSQDIRTLIPLGERFILVDQNQLSIDFFGKDFFDGYRVTPFLDREGCYWGPPADCDTAIRGLERLRRSGATNIVFITPAFWWLEYYTAFAQYLRSKFRCVKENERVLVFDLREEASIQGGS
jgi:glycosyltransferase involved in cell wall biosynthesis